MQLAVLFFKYLFVNITRQRVRTECCVPSHRLQLVKERLAGLQEMLYRINNSFPVDLQTAAGGEKNTENIKKKINNVFHMCI